MRQSEPSLSEVAHSIKNIDCKPPEVGYGALSNDVLFSILRNSRRRALLFELASEDELTIEAGEAATRIAEHEFGEDYDYNERMSVYAALIQTHIPMLIKHNVLDCARSSGTIKFGENATAVLTAYHQHVTGRQARPSHQVPQVTPVQ